MTKKIQGVYLITDTGTQHQFSQYELAEQALEAGVQLIQYRNKEISGRIALRQIEEIANLTRETNTFFIINDRADYARAGCADGVHLGQQDLPVSAARKVLGTDGIIGGTSSTLEEALQVENDGADYVALGHIFDTSTKKKSYPPRGLEALREVCSAVSLPVVAIGGITLENAPNVIEAGADIIAVSSAICRSENPFEETRRLVELFE